MSSCCQQPTHKCRAKGRDMDSIMDGECKHISPGNAQDHFEAQLAAIEAILDDDALSAEDAVSIIALVIFSAGRA